MKLQYNVLWVDDQKEKFEKFKYDQQLKEFIESLFFSAHLTFVETIADAITSIESRKYDVIFSDCNIGEKEKGDAFIKMIRERNVNTEVLFYSAQEEVQALKLDRISFFNIPNRSGYHELFERMKGLILLTTEKLLDLTNLRGLVMAEVSDLDAMMHTIVKAYFTTKERMVIFHDKITKDREKSFKKMLVYRGDGDCGKRCEHKWKEFTIDDIVDHMDASQLAHAINIIVNDEKKFHYDSYLNEIINVRNNLAHCKSEIRDGKEVLHTLKGKDVIYSADDIIAIRKNIKKYHDLFEKMLQRK